ncbi:MAG TPA: AI-2E family transporter [Stellaceae bacterium]|nr:AI-2E family transporter [Stellaceae bacterium]
MVYTARAMERQTTIQRNARLAVTAALTGLAFWILWDFIPALLWATIFAVATWPLYIRFKQRGSPRQDAMLAPLTFTLIVGLVFLVPVALMAIELGRETLFFARTLPDLEKEGLPTPQWLGELPWFGVYAKHWWQTNLADPHGAQQLLGRLDRGLVIDWTRTLGQQLARRSTVLVFTLLTLFFVYRDGARLVRDIEALVGRLVGPQGTRVGVQMVHAIRGTVNGLVLVGLGEGAVLAAAYVSLGLPHAALFGGATAVLAMIPFGAPLVFGLAALVLLSQDGLWPALILLGIGAVVVFVADHFVRPVLIGGAAKLPFLWVLLGILGGLEGFGLVGLFLGPAIMAALLTLWREWVAASREGEAGA